MSGGVNVNTDDKSRGKLSSTEKTYNMNAAETETKAPTAGSVAHATRRGCHLNTCVETPSVKKAGNSSSGERCENDGERGESKDIEGGASNLREDSGDQKRPGNKNRDSDRRNQGSSSASDGAALKSGDTRDTESTDLEADTKTVEESLEKLKMNIEGEADGTCQTKTSSQPVVGSAANASSANCASNEQNSQLGDKGKEGGKEGKEGKEDTSKEVSDSRVEEKEGGSSGACVQLADKTEAEAGVNESGKPGADDEDKNRDVEMESEPEDNSPPARSSGAADEDESGAKASESSRGQKEPFSNLHGDSGDKLSSIFSGEKTKLKEDENLKPSDFLPSRLAAIRREWSDRDTQMYRNGYPGKEDEPERLTMNLDFYQGRIRSAPDGDYIDNIHQYRWNDYQWLEVHHGYIQWLFPIRESGMNWMAQELQLHEAEAIKADRKAMKRFKKSYEMMLNFYGIHLISAETGEVEKASNWRMRFEHLNYSMHNYLRITRILKCLGELGLEHFKVPFLRLMLYEAIMMGYLHRTLESCYNYWVGTVRDDQERASVRNFAAQLCWQKEELREWQPDF